MTVYTISTAAELASFLVGAVAQPNDTLRLAAGTYVGDFVATIAGINGQPITIRPVYGARPVIDGSFRLTGGYVELYDLDFTDSRTNREQITPALSISVPGAGVFGCLVMDLHESGINWFGGGAGEVSESVFLNNGYYDELADNHGHALYSHNTLGGLRVMARNVFGPQIGRYGLHIYSGGANYLKDFHVNDNAMYSQPTHTGGGLGMSNFLYDGNVQYGSYAQLGRYAINQDGTIVDNVFIELSDYDVYDFNPLVESGNVVYGGVTPWPPYTTGYTVTVPPPSRVWVTPFTKSTRWLALVTIYNHDETETVDVDLSSLGLQGGDYRLRNAANFLAEWHIFAYSGDLVAVPMDGWTVAVPIGGSVPLAGSTFPNFGVFILEAYAADESELVRIDAATGVVSAYDSDTGALVGRATQ